LHINSKIKEMYKMAKECLWYNGEEGHYHLLDFDPNGLATEQITEKALKELGSMGITGEDASKAMETLYLIDVDDLIKVGGTETNSIAERILKLIECKSEATIKGIFEEALKLEAERARRHTIMDYMDEYRAYAKSCIEDPDFDLTTMEDFDTWVEEEKYEEKIRCKECGCFNTEQRGTIKHCTDCAFEDTITPHNQANWTAEKAQSGQVTLMTTNQAMKILEKQLDKDPNTTPEAYRALHSLWEDATPNGLVEDLAVELQ
jgi:hypothetical protein